MQWENNKDSTTPFPAFPEANDSIKFHNARFKLASPISGQVPFEKKTRISLGASDASGQKGESMMFLHPHHLWVQKVLILLITTGKAWVYPPPLSVPATQSTVKE